MKEVAEFYRDALSKLANNGHDRWPAIARAHHGRAYHNLNHLAEMIGHLMAVPSLPAPAASPTFALALVYHDYVYHPTRRDNEARSAEVCQDHLRTDAISERELTRCRELIMATKTHQPTAGDDGGEAWLIDLDLAVLARPTAAYQQYALAIRKEFWMYPGFLYRPGRVKVLRYFLGMDYIYKTDYGRSNWETRARANLEGELSLLGG